MPNELSVPAWYQMEAFLIDHAPTRYCLRQFHRVRKGLYKVRERWQSRKSPSNLRNFEKRVFSQNGEDGILEEIFRRIGTTNRTFVEFGVQDGTQCCTRQLLENAGWSGVWMECFQPHVLRARELFRDHSVKIVQQFLTAENVIEAFADAGVPAEPDLMVVDVDGNDYWIWSAVAGHYSPRVVVVEYNATFGPRAEWRMPYDPQHRYDDTAYFGASLSSFARLARRHGYCLVGCDSMGVNAFFVRADAAHSSFDGIGQPAHYHYVAPHYDAWFGHPVKNFSAPSCNSR